MARACSAQPSEVGSPERSPSGGREPVVGRAQDRLERPQPGGPPWVQPRVAQHVAQDGVALWAAAEADQRAGQQPGGAAGQVRVGLGREDLRAEAGHLVVAGEAEQDLDPVPGQGAVGCPLK